MLIKFENKSARVKSIAFHPKRPWALICLHNGQVQLWDYELPCLLQKYTDHDGPVRTGCFHSSQPLFATGGDDAKVRVYNYRTKKLLYTLTGHVDYVRCVQFHPGDLPWLVSASDDQTVRLWNWQSRTCVTTLTGHTHYVMSAQFHPKEDLIVTASLDQTVRVWDVGNVRRKQLANKGSGSHGGPGYPGMLSPRSPAQIELFSSSEGHVKFVLEGHDRGVNWACFHPTKSAIASASDDRSIKLWRFNEVRAWEVDTLRGHSNNVNMVLFHGDQLLSASEDKSFRVWDVSGLGGSMSSSSRSSSKSSGALHVFKRDDSRYWAVAVSPHSSYLGLAHDGGFSVFKLERERPPVSLGTDEHSVHYVRNGQLRFMDLLSPKEQTLMPLEPKKSYGGYTLYYSPSEKAILLSNKSSFELYVDMKKIASFSGSGCGVFVGKNRFITVNTSDCSILELRGLDGNTIKTIKAPFPVHHLFPAAAGTCLLDDNKGSLGLMDLSNGSLTPITTLDSAVHLCFWSGDMELLAVASKHQLCLLERSGSSYKVLVKHTEKASVIKGGAWEGRNLFFYNTPTHLKFLLVYHDDAERGNSVDNGLVCSLSTPLYLIKVKGEEAFFADRTGGLQSLSLDTTEFKFKLALRQGDFATVRDIVQSGSLVGQSIIAYLKNNSFADLALHFVHDNQNRFDLALQAKRPEVALESLKAMDNDESSKDLDDNTKQMWERLAQAAFDLGNVVIAETAYRRLRQYEKLVNLFLLTGQMDKMKVLGDEMYESHAAPQLAIWAKLYCQDWLGLTLILKTRPELQMLAWMAAMRTGNQKLIDSLSNSEANITIGPHTDIVQPVNPQNEPWPLLIRRQDIEMWTIVERDKKERVTQEPSELDLVSKQLDELEMKEEVPTTAQGWKIDEIDLENIEAEDDTILLEKEQIPFDEKEIYEDEQLEEEQKLESSQIPFIQLALGHESEALALLEQQVALAEESERLRKVINEVKSKCRQPDGSLKVDMFGDVIPVIGFAELRALVEKSLALTTNGKFPEAINGFREILARVLFSKVHSQSESDYILTELVPTCRDYILGLSMDLHRRTQANELDAVRQLELSCYFAHLPNLKDEHRSLALRSALLLAYKHQCYKLATTLAQKLMSLDGVPEDVTLQAQKIVNIANKNRRLDHMAVDYESDIDFEVCAKSYKPIYPGTSCVRSLFTGTAYKPDCGVPSLDVVSELEVPGQDASGLILF